MKRSPLMDLGIKKELLVVVYIYSESFQHINLELLRIDITSTEILLDPLNFFRGTAKSIVRMIGLFN